MNIPDNAFSKGIRRPDRAIDWILNKLIYSFVEKYIVTPLKSEYIFDHEWDVVIILDACRYDLAKQYIENNDTILPSPKRVYSAGSMSPDWIYRTFRRATDDQLKKTAYITGNVFSNEAPEDKLKHIEKVWEYAWDEELETVPPRPITERAIGLIQDNTADKYIVHYMQPHLPSVQDPSDQIRGFRPYEGQPSKNMKQGWEWKLAKEGQADVVIQKYWDNLGPVIREVEILLTNINASKVIITSDHGNYIGEKGRYGHPKGHMHSAVRNVPWWETEAKNEGTYNPDYNDISKDGITKSEKLEALGYM